MARRAPIQEQTDPNMGNQKDDKEDSDSRKEEEEAEEEDPEDFDTGLTDNQNRLLYLVSLYSHIAVSENDREEWVRKQALLVLMYEGIVANIFDYDYAPSSELVENRRIYINIAQDGKSDIDFLREEGLLYGLKVPTNSFLPVTCIQISERGIELLKKIPRGDREAVHELVYAPNSRELVQVVWDGESYWLKTEGGFERKSTITDAEAVCYVSSAYIPQCLRRGGRPTLSNAHRAHESGTAAAASTIRDELDELIMLNSVSIIVAEYIPIGSNQLVQINNNLGSSERVQGGFLSSNVDRNLAGTQLNVRPGLTSVSILDYSMTEHVNFEADIRSPQQTEVVQIEAFGVSITAEGSCFVGMQVEAVMDRIKDNISLDHLSRLIVDVHQDSSKVLDSVLSEHQKCLIDLIFMGDGMNRDKVNLIIANEITPHLTAEEYMDKGECENELKQVLGDTHAAYDITENDTLIFAEHGLLIAGPNCRHYEPILASYLKFVAMDIFLRNYYARLFILIDDIALAKEYAETSHNEPNLTVQMRQYCSQLAQQVLLMAEIMGFFQEGVEMIAIPPEPPEQAGRSLYEKLQIRQLKDQMSRRAREIEKTVEVLRNDLEILRELSSFVSEARLAATNETIEANTKLLCDLTMANTRATRALEVIQILLAGTLAFEILDRLTGGYTVSDTIWIRDLVSAVIYNLPLIWFLINLLFWASLSYGVIYLMKRLQNRADGQVSVHMKVARKTNIQKLKTFLLTRNIITEEKRQDESGLIFNTVTYTEKEPRDWGGFAPTITLAFEESLSYLLSITVRYNKNKAKPRVALNSDELRRKVFDVLSVAGIVESDMEQRLLSGSFTAAKDSVLQGGLPKKPSSANASSTAPTATSNADSSVAGKKD